MKTMEEIHAIVGCPGDCDVGDNIDECQLCLEGVIDEEGESYERTN